MLVLGQEHEITTKPIFRDNTRFVSNFKIDDSKLSDKDVLFDTTYKFTVYGGHSFSSGEGFYVAFMFGMPSRDSAKNDSSLYQAGYNVILNVSQNGTNQQQSETAGVETLERYVASGYFATVRLVASKGGNLDIYIGSLSNTVPTDIYASYTGINFNGYVAIDVEDKITHEDYEFTQIDNFSFKAKAEAKKYMPFAIEPSSRLITLPVGDDLALIYEILPSYATDKSVSFSSNKTAVATVNADGVVSAVSKGSADITITATDGGVSSTVTVEVVKAVDSIVLGKTSLIISVGESEILTATVVPEDAVIKDLVYSSSNEDIVSVSTDGTITAKSVGSAIITVKTLNGKISQQCQVTIIQPIKSIALDVIWAELEVGAVLNITATISPQNATIVPILFTSSDASIATVSDTGIITAIKAGKAIITATTQDGIFTAECELEVFEKQFKEVVTNNSGLIIAISASAVVTLASIGFFIIKKRIKSK